MPYKKNAGPPKRKGPTRTKHIHTTFFPAEDRAIRRLAKQQRISISDFVRACVVAKIGEEIK
jgi:hypothetical protein